MAAAVVCDIGRGAARDGPAAPHFGEVDGAWLKGLRESGERTLGRHLAAIGEAEPTRRRQAWEAVAADYGQLALVTYAAGEPLEASRWLLLDSARAQLEATRASDQPAARNANIAYLAICSALIGGDDGLAMALAQGLRDPPGGWAGDQQALAYGLRDHLLGRTEAARARLRSIRRPDRYVLGQLTMLYGVVDRDPAALQDGFGLTVAVYKTLAAKPENRRAPDVFLCLPALGLAALGLNDGLLQRDHLTTRNPFAPIELIA